jgi:hypothetical protein
MTCLRAMHYEFKPDPERMGRNTFVSTWTETDCRAIPLPYTPESLARILDWGSRPDMSPYTHQEIALWCDRMHITYLDVDFGPELERAIRVVADVDCQWDLFLANTYTLQQLQNMDFSNVRMPADWFVDWQNQLQSTTQEPSR